MRCYYQLVLKHPYVLLGTVFTLGALGPILIFFFNDRPILDFSQPKLGFETRGTALSDRIRTLNYLIESTVPDPSQIVSLRPTDLDTLHSIGERSVTPPRATSDAEAGDQSELWHSEELMDLSLEDQNVGNLSDDYFCDTPRSAYSKIVFGLKSDSSKISDSTRSHETLFTLQNLRSMCRVETAFIRSRSSFIDSCITETYSGLCCRSWSLGNYVALLSNKSSCDVIDEDDVILMLDLLNECAADFKSNLDCFTSAAATPRHCFQASQCRHHAQIVRNVLFYLVDFEFLNVLSTNFSSQTKFSSLRHVTSFLPLAMGQGAKELYSSIEGLDVTDGRTKLVAIDFGIKYDLFDEYLLNDTIWLVAGLLSIFILVWVYTASLWFTAIVMVTLFITIEMSYVIYTLVAQLRFFPFVNLLIVVIVVGVGVDDAFVYLRLWNLSRSRRDVMTPEGLVAYTIRTSARSMFATSATTSAALYSGAVSRVVALRCFGVFAGTTIVVCFLLTLVAIPAACVATMRSCRTVKCAVGCECKLHDNLCGKLSLIFERYLPLLVYRLRYFSIFLFTLLGVSGALVTLVHPKLHMPTTSEMKLFSSNHPFEVYDSVMRDRFAFERVVKSTSVMSLPLTFVWGVEPRDSSNGLDPQTGVGQLQQDESFNFTSPASQEFLKYFCRQIRATRFYRSETGMQLSNCFIENFIQFMKRPCEVAGQSWAPCCSTASFPYPSDLFENCLQVYIPELHSIANRHDFSPYAGVRYSKLTGKPVAIIVEFPSIMDFSANYSSADKFFRYMENWTKIELLNDSVPNEMRNGWFVSDLTFYDLQNTVAMGTPISVAVALATVAIVAFITTFNVILTIEAMVTVTLAVFTTVGILVLIGWELNVVESVTISIAVGLSVDYTMHYAMAYQRVTTNPSVGDSAEQRATSVAAEIGGTVTMAALTTLVVGVCLLPATVLAYRQLATFLIIIVVVSYFYAVFFFQALLLVIRPRHWNICRFLLPRCFTGPTCYSGVRSRADKTIYRHVSSTSNISTSVSTNRVTNSSDLQETEVEKDTPVSSGESERNIASVNKQLVTNLKKGKLVSSSELAGTQISHRVQIESRPRVELVNSQPTVVKYFASSSKQENLAERIALLNDEASGKSSSAANKDSNKTVDASSVVKVCSGNSADSVAGSSSRASISSSSSHCSRPSSSKHGNEVCSSDDTELPYTTADTNFNGNCNQNLKVRQKILVV